MPSKCMEFNPSKMKLTFASPQSPPFFISFACIASSSLTTITASFLSLCLFNTSPGPVNKSSLFLNSIVTSLVYIFISYLIMASLGLSYHRWAIIPTSWGYGDESLYKGLDGIGVHQKVSLIMMVILRIISYFFCGARICQTLQTIHFHWNFLMKNSISEIASWMCQEFLVWANN